jgi:hypothetical protein
LRTPLATNSRRWPLNSSLSPPLMVDLPRRSIMVTSSDSRIDTLRLITSFCSMRHGGGRYFNKPDEPPLGDYRAAVPRVSTDFQFPEASIRRTRIGGVATTSCPMEPCGQVTRYVAALVAGRHSTRIDNPHWHFISSSAIIPSCKLTMLSLLVQDSRDCWLGSVLLMICSSAILSFGRIR